MCKNLMWAGQELDPRTLKPEGKPKFLIGVKVDQDEWFIRNMARRAFKTSFVRILQIPCGQCIECRLNNSREWADRCMLEAREHEKNMFITLTYDNENLPIGEKGIPTLKPIDKTLFWKRFRKWLDTHYPGTKIKYKDCGEYGDEKGRPHYHAIVFGYDMPDKKYWFSNHEGDPIYISKTLDKIWGKGITTVAECNWKTCAYVARYILKKQTGKNAKIYEDLGILPEYTGQSTRPAIGKIYYEKNKDKIYKNDGIYILRRGKIEKVKPSRYYDKLYDIEEPEKIKEIKQQRKSKAEGHLKTELAQTDLNYEEYMEIKENAKEQQIKALKRNFETRQI